MRLLRGALVVALCAATGGCYYEVDPMEVVDDLGVGDAGDDLGALDLSGDGPRCPGGGAPAHVGELSEAPIDRWGAEALAPITVSPAVTTVVLASSRVAAGEASLRLDTNNGQAGLFYPKTRDGHFDLTPYLYVSFSVTADDSSPANDPGWQGAQPHLLLVADSDNYLELVPTTNRLPRTPGAFVGITVPLAGGSGWTLNQFGTPSLADIHYLALVFDSWGAGFTVWVDDFRLGPGEVLDCRGTLAPE